jgi:hypothetical protein
MLAGNSEWVNPEDIAEAQAMHKSQSDRLLVIDDELWYETKPPCIAVETLWDKFKPSESSVVVRYRYLPDAMDQTPSSYYFPLAHLDLARETAHRVKHDSRMNQVIDRVTDISFEDHPCFSFDTVEDLVTRTGHAVALSLLSFQAMRPDKIDASTGEWLNFVGSRFHAHNPVIGVDVDFASMLPQLVETYLRLDTPKSGGLLRYQKPQLRKLLPTIVDALADMPVAVPTSEMKPSFGRQI